jgi:hypothetical protein
MILSKIKKSKLKVKSAHKLKVKSADKLKVKSADKLKVKSKDKLENYNWGLGIEHEMHLFHRPLNKSNKNIENVILFNSIEVVNEMLKSSELSSNNYDFLKKIPFEWSGRQCDGKVVIQRVPIQMPEFVTDNPFCSIKNKRNLMIMATEIIQDKERYIELLRNNKDVVKLEKIYGELVEHPFGMTRYLKYPIKKVNNKYTFQKDLSTEYNGSYHITFTLPYTEKTTNKEFIKMHQNFANQLQWLEPLMLAAYFTGDEYAPGSLKRVRGSFRVMIIGWGNLAGSDVRLFKDGIGRYAKTPTYWRKNLKFIDSDKLKACYKPSQIAKEEGAITSLSSNFRTFGSTDPKRPWHRESGTSMTKPNGVEFRIFDHFKDEYISHLMLFVSLIAENSRVKETNGYVYKNKVWINEVHNIMENGYKAQLSKEYINLLRNKLGLKINIKSIIANDVFKEILNELWEKNIKGKWSKIFHAYEKNKEYYKLLKDTVLDYYPDVNKNGWQFAFMMKLNRNKKLLETFNNLSNLISGKKIKFEEFKLLIIKYFGNNWINDIENIIHFYESNNHATIKLNENGIINEVKFKTNIKKYDNFNMMINFYFNPDNKGLL